MEDTIAQIDRRNDWIDHEWVYDERSPYGHRIVGWRERLGDRYRAYVTTSDGKGWTKVGENFSSAQEAEDAIRRELDELSLTA